MKNRKKTVAAMVLILGAVFFMTGFSDSPTIGDSAVPLFGSARVKSPTAPGATVYEGGGAALDVSNLSEGYVAARYSGNHRAKVQITKAGGLTYTYDLRNDGVYEFFPITGGDGSYKADVFYNLYSNQYALAVGQTLSVQLRDPLSPFLYPNQFVNYNAQSNSVALGETLAKGKQTELEVVSAIYNYVVENLSYDNHRASLVANGQLNGYVPNVDQVLAEKKGICFDYAALMAAMLRSQEIATRMEFGYVSGGAYHAWISTYIKEIGWINGVIQFDGVNWKLMDPTFASSANSSPEIMKYIGEGRNYRTQFIY